MMRDFSQTSAGKVNLNSSVTELKLSRNLRLRYQYDNRQPKVDNPTNLDQRSTFRYRLRIGAGATLGANWSASFQLQGGQIATPQIKPSATVLLTTPSLFPEHSLVGRTTGHRSQRKNRRIPFTPPIWFGKTTSTRVA